MNHLSNSLDTHILHFYNTLCILFLCYLFQFGNIETVFQWTTVYIFYCSLLSRIQGTLGWELRLDEAQDCLQHVIGKQSEPNTGNCVLGKGGLEKQKDTSCYKCNIWRGREGVEHHTERKEENVN